MSKDGINEGWQARMADLFAPLEVLASSVRLELAALVDVPGQAPALTPDELGRRPLPVKSDVLAAIGAAISAGVDAAAVVALRERRLDAVVLVLRRVSAGATLRSLPERLRTIIVRHAPDVDVRQLTVGEVIGWPGVGTRSATSLLRSIVTTAVEVIAAETPDHEAAGPTLDDVATVLTHDAQGSGEVCRAIRAVAAGAPPSVARAAERLLGSRQEDRRLQRLSEALAAAGDIRDRAVFEHVVLGLGAATTKRDVGVAMGIGVERVRQLAVRATVRVEEVIDALPTEVVELAAESSRQLGSAAPESAVEEVLASLGFPALPDSRSRLLLRLAGPYSRVDGHHGWVAIVPDELLGETRRLLLEDGGIRMLEHVEKELAALGVADHYIPAWLDRQAVRIVDGLVVATSGRPGDIAERVLHASGRPMTVDEVTAWMPSNLTGGDTAWTSDRRFVVTDEETIGLAEWHTAGATAPPSTLHIVVDHDVLAGGNGPVPRSLAGALGMRPGAHRTVSTRYGPLAVLHDGDTPARGSVRPIALAVGAGVGDELAIAIYPDGRDATVTVVRRADPAAALR